MVDTQTYIVCIAAFIYDGNHVHLAFFSPGYGVLMHPRSANAGRRQRGGCQGGWSGIVAAVVVTVLSEPEPVSAQEPEPEPGVSSGRAG